MLTSPVHRFLCRFARRGVFALAVMFCLSAGLLFTGCPMEGEAEAGDLNGTWMSAYNDGYTFDLNAKTFSYDDGGWGYDYEGDIKEITYSDNGFSGIIYFEYTAIGANIPDTSLVGKFNAIYFKGLTHTNEHFATASNSDYSYPATATLPLAKDKFTADTLGKYVFAWSACVKE